MLETCVQRAENWFIPVPKPNPAKSSSNGAPPEPARSNEVVAKPSRRRTFSPAEKLRIVREADACTEPGEVAALLRREGIYSSHLAAWRKLIRLQGTERLGTAKPGRKPKLDAKDRRIVELEKEAARLKKKLFIAEQLVELQKKVAALLGTDTPNEDPS